MTDATKLFSEIAQPWVADPAKLLEAQGELLRNYMQLGLGIDRSACWAGRRRPWRSRSPGTTASRIPTGAAIPTSISGSSPTSSPCAGSKTCWTGPKASTSARASAPSSISNRWASALSPSNFPLTNPEVLRETFATSGKNLVQGMANLVHDLEKSGDLLSISQTDTEAFEVGRNIATAPGKVDLPERSPAA